MAGRHTRVTPGGRARKRWLAAVSVLVLIAVGVTLFVTTRDKSHEAQGPRCAGTVDLQVQTAPTIAAPVSDIGRQWSAGRPVIDGRCVTVAVTSAASVTAEADLASASGAVPALWIPDSSLWSQRLRADDAAATGAKLTIDVGASVASSPIVIVAPPSTAAALNASAGVGWRVAVSGKYPVTIADPVKNSEGVLSMLAVRSLLGGVSADTDRTLAGLMVQISHSALPDVTAGFKLATASPAKAPLFTASEQEVIAANAGKQTPVATAVYPSEGTLSLDYPVVRIGSPADDPDLARAAIAFTDQLRTSAARTVLAKAGLRDPAGDPLEGLGPQTGASGTAVRQLSKSPSASQAVDTLRLWSAATQDSHTLAVIDVSGSMADPAGNGQTKIQLAAAAAAAGVSFFPDTSDLGLWVFSTDQTATTDWAELVPIGPLSGKVGNATRRQALEAATQQLPARVHGDTALYDTVLAAFQDVRNTYSPGKANAVVLMTDGTNVDPNGISLPQLLSTLRAQVDPARPVPMIMIGIGDQADAAALQQISAVTGGKTYIVKNPVDVRGVFLDAVVQRQCRPRC